MMNGSLYELKDLVERLGETLSHLDLSQGDDLKGLLDKERAPKEESPTEEASESPKDEDLEIVIGKPKQEVGALGSESSEKLPGEEEMSDDELNELLKKHLS